MANWDNAAIQAEQEQWVEAFDEGLVAGYDAVEKILPEDKGLSYAEFQAGAVEAETMRLNPLPAVAYKRLMDLTARERGFVLGWLVRTSEHLGTEPFVPPVRERVTR